MDHERIQTDFATPLNINCRLFVVKFFFFLNNNLYSQITNSKDIIGGFIPIWLCPGSDGHLRLLVYKLYVLSNIKSYIAATHQYPVVKLKACVGLFVDVLVVSVYRWLWAIIICKRVLDTRNSLEIPKEDRHYNDQMKKNKMTNNDLQNTKAKQLNPSPSFLCESTVILNSSSCIIYLQLC